MKIVRLRGRSRLLDLRERGTSLLPVGVVEVLGEFDAGDAVEVALDDGPIGKGIVNYSAEELRQIKGLKLHTNECLCHYGAVSPAAPFAGRNAVKVLPEASDCASCNRP